MEKTKHSVVKHLIAVAVALLLFGSSGGVAWGQLAPYDAIHHLTTTICEGTTQAQSILSQEITTSVLVKDTLVVHL